MKKNFAVYPNPYIAIDHDGYPAGACPADGPEHVGMTVRKWVGATLDSAETMLLERLTKEERQYRDARQQTRFKFHFEEPTQIPNTEYYKDRIQTRELIAADRETHVMAGGKPDEFREPIAVLQASKAAALKQWSAERGPGATPEHINVLDQLMSRLTVNPAQDMPGFALTLPAPPLPPPPEPPMEAMPVPVTEPSTPSSKKAARGG